MKLSILDPPVGRDTTPAVMLSPNASKRVTASFGGPRTVTPNTQLAVCCSASEAPHVTSVMPIPKALPECGEHPAVTGGWPPLTTGAAKCTVAGLPSNDWDRPPAGQAIARRPILSAGNGEGVAGGNTDDSAHADSQSRTVTTGTSVPLLWNLTTRPDDSTVTRW